MGYHPPLRGSDQQSALPASMARIQFFLGGHAETGDGISWDEFVMSPSGRFVLLTVDAYSIGGKGPGRYRLVETDAGLRCDGRLGHPSDGKVADSGIFALVDRPFSHDLRCQFLVMTADGRPVIDEAFGANALRVDICDDGRFAAIHLAGNPDAPEYDELFTVYDVTRGTKLWSKPLECGRAESATFDPARGLIHLTTKAYGSFDYRLADGAIDEWEVREAILSRGSGFDILTLVTDEVEFGPLSRQRATRLVADCERASAMLGGYPDDAARALRLAGEILEAQGDRKGALDFWRRAHALRADMGGA